MESYLACQAGEDIKRRVSACCVALEFTSGKVAGFYPLAAGRVPLNNLPPSAASPSTKRSKAGNRATHCSRTQAFAQRIRRRPFSR